MKNSPDKIERMKEVLADSYPKTAEEDRRPLPAAAKQLLEKSSPKTTEADSQSLWQRLREFLRGPQLIGLGAAAVLVIMVALQFAGDPPIETTDPTGTSFRSGGGEELPAQLVVLRNLSDQQVGLIQGSGYFQKEQVLVLDADDDFQNYRDHQVVLLDGSTGEITTPFASTKFTQSMASDPDDLVSQILDVLATFTDSE